MSRSQPVSESGLETVGSPGLTVAHTASGNTLRRCVEWSFKPKKWRSLGSFDLIPQLNEGQRLVNHDLVKYGIFGARGRRTMRDVCMSAEACAHYYAMTGDALTLEALKAAVKAFRKYRHKARAHPVPYEGIDKKTKPDSATKPTIEYEMISCHVGRNMRGMRAAAHVLQDEQLLREAAEELNWWIDNPIAFNREKHFFDARIFLDEKGDTIGSERKYTMNMGGSLACAMWLVGNDLGDERLMNYAEDQIINGICPHQLNSGYFPYNIRHKYQVVDGIALDSNHYHGLTLQVMSPLLAHKHWRHKSKFVKMIQRGAKYIRDKLTFDTGVVKHPGHIAVIRAKKLGFCPKAPYGSTVNSALVHTRTYKYLGDKEALTQAARNLRWLYWNTPSCIPFFHCFRETVLMAWEGIHLKQKDIRDVEVVFVE